MESKDKIMLQCFRPNDQQVKIPNQQSADRFLKEENMDLLFNSGMVNTLLKTNGGTECLILLEGSYSMIY